MKRKLKWIGIALIAAVLVFGLTGCPEEGKKVDPPIPEPTGEAFIKELVLKDSEVEMPAEISAEIWEEYENFADLEEEFSGAIAIYSPQGVNYLGEIEKLVLSKNAKASIYIFRNASNGNIKPEDSLFIEYDPEAPAVDNYGVPALGLPANQNNWRMFVKVENETSGAVNYYRFLITISATNPNAQLNSVTLTQGATTTTVNTTVLNTGNANTEGFADIAMGEINFTAFTSAEVVVTYVFNHNITTGTPIKSVKIGKAPAATATVVPTLTDVTEAKEYKSTFADGDVIYIEVTAESNAKRFYKLQVQVGRNNHLTSLGVKIGSTTIAATLGTTAETWNAAGIGTGAVVKPTGGKTGDIVAVAEDVSVTIRYAVGGDDVEPTWGTTAAAFTFVHGQFIWVEVKTTTNFVRIYKVKIEFSSSAQLVTTESPEGSGEQISYYSDGFKLQFDAAGTMKGLGATQGALASSTFATLPVTAGAVANIGSLTCNILFEVLPATIKLELNLDTASADATIQYSFGAVSTFTDVPTTNWRSYSRTAGTMERPSSAGQYIFVKVTAADGITVKYYVGKINYQQGMVINYGSPSVGTGTLDAIWSDHEKYPWNYITNLTTVTGDRTDAYKALVDGDTGNGQAYTWGRAKLAWDETGIYIFAVVGKHNSLYVGGTTASSAHNYDSVELFINERVDSSGTVYTGNGSSGASGATNSSYTGRGGQYRINPASTTVGGAGNRSGDPAVATTGFNNATTFPSYAWPIAASDTNALKNMDITDTDGSKDTGTARAGYIVTFKAPFRFATSSTGADSGTAVSPAAPWPVANGKQIGIDIQLNVAQAAATRGGVMIWKNTLSTNYQNCKNWGVATLAGKP